MDLLDRLFAHDRWATIVLFDTCEPLSEGQWHTQFDIGHEDLHATFGHLIGNIEAWTLIMQEQPIELDDDWSIPHLRPRWERAYDAFESFSRQISTEHRLDDTFIDHFDAPQTFGAAIPHVILHNEGHRTEILHILTRLGIDPVPEIDHALWDFHRRGLFAAD